ncbi:MAG TPA: serine/threonine-protein kinase, partial [Thermoanaerobaculia bacterium]|nr:serine/threonine-protein kinase [Thermoanaerobaculia bacterium]
MQVSASFPYRIEGRVGEGAMGTVYKAVDPDLNRFVAIKVMRRDWLLQQTSEGAAEARARFQQEARAAARLSHPGVAVIHRIGEEEGQPYIVMEWLEGETLESVLKKRSPLPPGEAARIGVALAEALDAAHVAGVVHRDIKPSNLVLLADGRLKVTDFGIARLQGSDLVKTQAGDVLATPMYGSPEQLKGDEIDGRSDIFSAGIVLYLALTGRAPFNGRTLAELVSSILLVEPAPPCTWNPEVPPSLEAVVLRALEKSPAKRYSTARDFAQALRPFATDPSASPGASSAPSAVKTPETPFPFARTALGEQTTTRPNVERAKGVITDLPSDGALAAAEAVRGFEARSLGRVDVKDLLNRLLEFPLHAEPFSGGVLLDSRALFLLHRGAILGAVETKGGIGGDALVDAFLAAPGGMADASLHAVPGHLSSEIVPLLASLLGRRVVRHADLDSSFVSLPALGKKLEAEGFSGVLTLRREKDAGWILLSKGKAVLSLFSGEWRGAPLQAPWESWVTDKAVKATVEEATCTPLMEGFRHLLHDFPVAVESEGSDGRTTSSRRFASSTLLKLGKKIEQVSTSVCRVAPAESFQSGARPGAPPPAAVEEAFALDPAHRFLSWSLAELPLLIAERKKAESLKYVHSWLPLVKTARLHHALPRPGSRESDDFDVVTFDAEGKVLHLAQRVSRGTAAAVKSVIE